MRHRKRFTREFKLEAARLLGQGLQGNSTPTPISLVTFRLGKEMDQTKGS